MRVRGEAVGEPAAHQPGRDLPRARAVVAEQRGDVDLQQRAGFEVRVEPVERAGGALGVGEQQAVAEAGRRATAASKTWSRPANGHSSSSHGACVRALGDQLELALVELQRVLVGELAAGMQADGQPVGVEHALGLGAAVGELVEVDEREVGALDVRGAGDVADALGVQPASETPGLLHRRGPVVQAGEEVGVQVHVSHCP